MRQPSEQLGLQGTIDALFNKARGKDGRIDWALYPAKLARSLEAYRDDAIKRGVVIDLNIWQYTQDRLQRREDADNVERAMGSGIGDILQDMKYVLAVESEEA